MHENIFGSTQKIRNIHTLIHTLTSHKMDNVYNEMLALNYVVNVENDENGSETYKLEPNFFEQPNQIDLTTPELSPSSSTSNLELPLNLDTQYKDIINELNLDDSFSEENLSCVEISQVLQPELDHELLTYLGGSGITPPPTPDYTNDQKTYYTMEATNIPQPNNESNSVYGQYQNYPAMTHDLPTNYFYYQQHPPASVAIVPQNLPQFQQEYYALQTIPTPEPSPEPIPEPVQFNFEIPEKQTVLHDEPACSLPNKTTTNSTSATCVKPSKPTEKRKRRKTYVQYTGDYACELCDRTFGRRSNLTQHNKSHHSGPRQFRCKQCGKRYQFQAELDTHTKRHAATEKPFHCSECAKRFCYRMDLSRHFNLHHGNVPFRCPECGKGFVRADHLSAHLVCHARRTAPRQSAGKGKTPK